ncbi:MAG: pyridoxal phosphate-dependent aminotransferase [Fimbriimonadaceae bacterium]
MNRSSLSARAAALKPSPTLSITAKARAMKAQGIDVLSFAAGEPDFNTPEPICRAATEALQAGFTKYTASSGTPELKEAICAKLLRENGLRYEPSQIVASCGAKHSLYNALMVLLDPGDEVLLFAPYWMTYAEQIALAGGVPVVVRTEGDHGFVPDLEAVAAAVTPRTRAIVLNSPSNPTGAVFPRPVVEGLAELALRHNLWIVSDEIYERLVYGVRAVSPASLSQEVYERTVTINGCSKSYAMTGWRIGFAAAPKAVAAAMSNFQDQVTSNPTSFAQKGAVAAFHLPEEAVETMRAEFEARRDLIVGLLRQIPGLKVPKPDGAFYAFPNVSAYLGGRFPDDAALCEHLLEEARVATVPGSVFEGPGHLRLSYATGRRDIEEGVARIAEALAKIAP